MAEVTLTNVSKLYPGGVKAVDNVSLGIRNQEFVVLVGPSGCGKSTTLRMVAGLEDISSGEIRIGGRVVNDVPPKDRDIAMVFQNYALYPHMTVYRNMAFALLLRRRYAWWDHFGARILAPRLNRLARDERSAIDRRVRDAAALLGIEGLLNRRPRELSGGQRQRVAVGRAIVREPQAFLFDEPLSNLDAKLRIELRGEIKRLHRRLATTTIYVTHDQEEAMSLGDRVVVMKDGVVQQVGPPLEVYAHPQNRFVAGFVGAPPMNFVEGQLRRGADGVMFEGAGVRLALTSRQSAQLSSRNSDVAVVLGVRPEHGALTATPNSSALDLEILDVEPLGDRADLRVLTPTKNTLTFRVDSRDAVGLRGMTRVHIDMSSAHIFENNPMGRNLTLAPA